MGHTYLLRREVVVPAPLDAVFAFFADAGNLERLTPSTTGFVILTPRPIDMHAGTLIDYRIRIAGIPTPWRTLIETWDPPHAFSDVQLRGPYRRWDHRHTFTAVDAGHTRVRDEVFYEMPFGPLGRLAHALFVKRMLDAIFDYRTQALAAIFPETAR